MKEGIDWSNKHYGVSERIKVQLLPANKSGSNPRRLAVFITFQGRKGRKGLRLSNKQMYDELVSDLVHDKTIEVMELVNEINGNNPITETNDDL